MLLGSTSSLGGGSSAFPLNHQRTEHHRKFEQSKQHSKQYNKKQDTDSNEHTLSKAWTVNVAGLSGFWRMEIISTMSKQERPLVVAIQEVRAGKEEWLATLNRTVALGYKAYATDNVLQGSRANGVVTLVDTQLQAAIMDQVVGAGGAALAVRIGHFLHLNCYFPVRTYQQPEFAEYIEEMINSLDWKGKWMFTGDFNDEPCFGWSQALFGPLGAFYIPIKNTTTTRWDGKRIIDYYYHDMDHHMARRTSRALDTHLSDRKIIEILFCAEKKGSTDRLFKKQPGFQRPNWLTQDRWQKLFDKSYEHHQLHGWDEACALADATYIGTQPEDQNQSIVDYAWNLTMTKMLTILKTASYLAILEIPDDCHDKLEINRVTHLANHLPLTRLGIPQQQDRQFPKLGTSQSIHISKLRNQLGKSEELFRLLTRPANDQQRLEIKRLKQKLQSNFNDFSVEGIRNSIQHLKTQIHQHEQKHKKANIKQWQRNMQKISNRSAWLHRKKTSYYPPLATQGESKTTTKEEALNEIHTFWQTLHYKVAAKTFFNGAN